MTRRHAAMHSKENQKGDEKKVCTLGTRVGLCSLARLLERRGRFTRLRTSPCDQLFSTAAVHIGDDGRNGEWLQQGAEEWHGMGMA